MIEYQVAGFQYIELLNDPEWAAYRKINIEKRRSNFTLINHSDNIFNPPYWKIVVRRLLSMLRLSRQLHVNIFTIFLAKLGVIKNLRPSLLVVPNKDIAEMLQYPKRQYWMIIYTSYL